MLVKIAEIVFSLICDIPNQSIVPHDAYESFLSSASPDVRIRYLFRSRLSFKPRKQDKLISRGCSSDLYRTHGGDVVLVSGQMAAPHMLVFFRHDFCDIEVVMAWPGSEVDPTKDSPLLPEFPSLRLVMNCLMAQRRGLLVHGCGVVDEGKGYLFAGHSDDGKSTMARLWGEKTVVLGDEIIALLYRAERFWLYGTPWPGDYRKVSYGGVPLDKVFFLGHWHKNVASPVGGAKAGSMLIARSFVALWDKSGMELTLDAVGRLVQDVPCYELGFVPDADVIDFVRGIE